MTTIDLGVLPPAGDNEPPPPDSAGADPAGGWSRRPMSWVAGVLGALLMLTVTASAAPRLPWAVPVFTVPLGAQVESGGVTLTQDMLYVHGRTPGDQITLTAYRLSDGTLRWEQVADHVDTWSGKPVLWNPTEDESGSTTLLDPETGRPHWQGAGDLAAVAGDRMLVRVMEPMPPEDGELRWRTSLTALDRQTVQEVWSLPAVDSWDHVAPGPGRPGRLVTVDGFRLSTHDLATGSTLATVEIQGVQPASAARVVRDVVLVQQAEPVAAVRAFELETLRPLWTREFRADVWSLAECGELVCAAGGRLTALDPATGEQAWSGPWLGETGMYDAGWLPGYIVVNERGETYSDEIFYVIDATTGEAVMNLGAWRPLYYQRYRPPGDGLGGMVTRYDPNREPVIEQLGPNQQEIRFRELGRTWFARLDPDQGRLEVLGAVDGGPTGCQATVGNPATSGNPATAGHVACERDGNVDVWRVR